MGAEDRARGDLHPRGPWLAPSTCARKPSSLQAARTPSRHHRRRQAERYHPRRRSGRRQAEGRDRGAAVTEYLVIYEMGDSGEWGAYAPDLPGCVAVGDSRSQVEQLMREALPDHIALMREVAAPVPEPRHRAGSVAP